MRRGVPGFNITRVRLEKDLELIKNIYETAEGSLWYVQDIWDTLRDEWDESKASSEGVESKLESLQLLLLRSWEETDASTKVMNRKLSVTIGEFFKNIRAELEGTERCRGLNHYGEGPF